MTGPELVVPAPAVPATVNWPVEVEELPSLSVAVMT